MNPQNAKRRSRGNLVTFAFMAIFVVGLIYILPFDKLFQSGLPQNPKTSNRSPVFTEAVEMTVRGKITRNDVSMSQLQIEGANGPFIVIYRSISGECKNPSIFGKVKNLKKDTEVEAFGKFDGQEVEVCSSKTYFINTEFCGDSVCNLSACSDDNCPKTENPANCPADCHEKPDRKYTVKELKKNIYIGQTYEVEGFVVGTACIECINPQIMISDRNENLSEMILSGQRMLLFVDKKIQFEKETKYLFTIYVKATHSTIDSLPDINLINYQLISDGIK